MKNKIIKLARRLNHFTIEDIEPLLQCDTAEIKPLLDELLNENILFNRNGLYFYQESRQTLDSITKCKYKFMLHTKETIELLFRGFCVDIVPEKMSLIIGNVSRHCCNSYYMDYRKILYEIQENELLRYNSKEPQCSWTREFFGKPYYFYCYNQKIYISKRKLKEPKKRVLHNKKESALFKKVYSYLVRKVWHEKCTKNAPYHLADAIWRKDKTFEELLRYLFNIFHN